jgi:adenylate cyclase
MAQLLTVEVAEKGQTVFTADITLPVEMGRQRSGEPEPYHLLPPGSGPARLLVARQREGNISRQHVLLDTTPAGAIRVHNLSPAALVFESGPALPASAIGEQAPPFVMLLAGRSIRVAAVESADSYGLRSLDAATVGPGSLRVGTPPLLQDAFASVTPDTLLGYLQTTLGVLQSTLGALDFLQQAVQAMVDIVSLSSGRVLLFDGDGWNVLATAGVAVAGWEPSHRVLDHVRREKRTVWQEPSPAAITESQSLHFVQTVVAAPLLHPDGRVIGALYGERRREHSTLLRPIGKLEALLVDVLACGVATGLARQEQQRAAVAAQVRFEQFFTPELARHLAREPTLLEGREAEVTLLFCDVRGFTRISRRLGPAATVEWVGAVMDVLSGHVLDAGGVLVDYIGDEMLAMWGAPQPQPDHAERAVRSALAMSAALPALNARWQPTLGESMSLGIGLNTGAAHVGNTGSRYKFKYGPLGHAVNLASRVQGVTRYLKCSVLLTAQTKQSLGEQFIVRRVCRARMVNIDEPVDLFEVAAGGDPARQAFLQESEAALQLLEQGEFSKAAGVAGTLLQQHPGDGPLRLTLARAVAMLVNEEAPFDPVWVPPGK